VRYEETSMLAACLKKVIAAIKDLRRTGTSEVSATEAPVRFNGILY
jgi:hypothetical protein